MNIILQKYEFELKNLLFIKLNRKFPILYNREFNTKNKIYFYVDYNNKNDRIKIVT